MGIVDDDELNASMRNLGTSYDVQSILAFGKAHFGNKDGASNHPIEYGALGYISDRDSKLVTIDTDRSKDVIDNKIFSVRIPMSTPNSNGFPVITIHNHHKEGESVITKYSIFTDIKIFGSGPSYESEDGSGDMPGSSDRQQGNEELYKQSFYDVVIDPDNIHLYKGSYQYGSASEGKRRVSPESVVKVPIKQINEVRKNE